MPLGRFEKEEAEESEGQGVSKRAADENDMQQP